MKGVIYHPRVPSEVRDATAYYEAISPRLGDGFWEELTEAIERARAFPELHHFDPSGLRRCNLKRFPYHFLFQNFADYIRIVVVRHNRRNPNYGLRRR
ncbi:MAG: type II toxin-antitoxin system RelE/ParE family toxin [Verrucomicrobiae bacterium]|nr:type II toxin-antitoxin system RelE/ParE family toxin [Verrucomicrobiae bacterium]